MSKAFVVLCSLCVVLSACGGGGGRLSAKALQQEAKTVQSLAAEGELIAESAARAPAPSSSATQPKSRGPNSAPDLA